LPRRHVLALVALALLAAVACHAAAPAPAAPAGSPPAAAPPAAGLTDGPAAAPTAPEALRLRLGLAYTPVSALPLSVLWLAKDLGYYEREGLDVDLLEMPGTPTVVSALLAGDADVGNIATEDVIRLAASGTLDLRALHSPDPRVYFLIAARDGLASAADLAGQTFGIARPGSLDQTMTVLVLQDSGVDPAAVRFVSIGAPSGRAQALVAGQIDATSFSIATFKAIEREPGVKVLVGVDDYFAAAPVVTKVDAAPTRTLRDKPEELRRFTTALLRASRRFADDRQAWVEAMSRRRPDIEPSDLDALWDQFRTSWAVNGALNPAAYRQTTEFVYQSEGFKDVPRIGVPDWVDGRILDRVLGEIGVDGRFDDPGRPIP